MSVVCTHFQKGATCNPVHYNYTSTFPAQLDVMGHSFAGAIDDGGDDWSSSTNKNPGRCECLLTGMFRLAYNQGTHPPVHQIHMAVHREPNVGTGVIKR